MKRYVSSRLRRAGDGASCVLCGTNNDTVQSVPLPDHGRKLSHDYLRAHLCVVCSAMMYDPESGAIDYRKRYDALSKTLERLFRHGIIRSVG